MLQQRPTKHTCERCGGTGQVLDDQELGAWYRQIRLSKGVSLRNLASHMGISATYLSDLESGKRKWNLQREQQIAALLCLSQEEMAR